MSNSLELLTGPIVDIQKKYEIFSDIIVTGLLNTEVRYMVPNKIEIQRLASLTYWYIKKFLKARGNSKTTIQ